VMDWFNFRWQQKRR